MAKKCAWDSLSRENDKTLNILYEVKLHIRYKLHVRYKLHIRQNFINVKLSYYYMKFLVYEGWDRCPFKEVFLKGNRFSFGNESQSRLANTANTYMFKINKRNARKRHEICSKLTTKTLEQRHWRRPGVFIAKFEHISHLFLVFLLLTLNK